MSINVFLSGQSNSLGRNAGGPSWSNIDPKVLVWNSSNPLGAPGTDFVSPSVARSSGTFDTTTNNNFAVWFCDRLARETGEEVRLVVAARGGSPISYWSPSETTYPLLSSCINTWSDSGLPPADIFLWHQGEGDSGGEPDPWIASFTQLLSNLETGGVIDDNTVLVVGGLADQALPTKGQFNETAIKKIAEMRSNTGYADPSGLATSDGTHFTGDALTTLGSQRYYAAYEQASVVPIYSMVNKGGTPGVPDSGVFGTLNISDPLSSGYRLKGRPLLITVSRTYTPAPDVAALMVEVVGGGGGGGAALSTGEVARASTGGAAGAHAVSFIEAPEASYSVVVGEGGAGGATAGLATAGGTSSFGNIIAPGGEAGYGSNSLAAVFMRAGPPQPLPTGGDYHIAGDSTTAALKLNEDIRLSGSGGGTLYGVGGAARQSNSATTPVPAFSGTGYGAGGGGAVSSTTEDQSGGDGAPGLVIVREYVRPGT